MYVVLIDAPFFFHTFLDTPYPSGCFWSCVTYADVLPPTVTHLRVPGFPDGCRHIRLCSSSRRKGVYQYKVAVLPFALALTKRKQGGDPEMGAQLTHLYLKSQPSGNFVSSAFTLTAILHTSAIQKCNCCSCLADNVWARCSGWILAW